MKKTMKAIGTFAFVIALVFTFTACSNGGGGGGWDSEYKVGDTGPAGGKIFYVSETAAGFTVEGYTGASGSFAAYTAHYIEAAPADQSTDLGLGWASAAFIHPDFGGTGDWVDIPGTGTGIGAGRKNTSLILATDADAPAAKACKDYSGGGKTDWFLPSKDELNELYKNKAKVGNFTTGDCYWPSSQFNTGRAWLQGFSYNGQFDFVKSRPSGVRAVRAF
jgi:hypothetical protein